MSRPEAILDPYANRAYADEFAATAPAIYRDRSFLEGIIAATSLQQGDKGRNIAEFMSGTGTVGQKIAERFPENTIWFIDTSITQLGKIPDQQHVIQHDVRNGLPEALPKLDGAVARFGVKNLLRDQQQRFVVNVAEKLVYGGWLVVADMVSPKGLQPWHNAERRLKHQLEGHDVEKDGAGNIPYLEEWISFFENAGLVVELAVPLTSDVITTSWKKSGQFAGDEVQQEAALQTINRMLLTSPDDVKKAFNIHQEGNEVRIIYPLRVFRAVKKLQKQ